MSRKKIDISNYEEWFIDQLDGTLSESDQARLAAFLNAHPALREELEGMAEIQLKASSHVYPDPFDLLAPTEKELSSMYLAEVSYGEAPSNANDEATSESIQYWQQVILQADERLVYPDKEALLKKSDGIVIPLYVQRFAAAASIIGVALLFIFNTEDPTYDPRKLSVQLPNIDIEDAFTSDSSAFAGLVRESSERPIEDGNPESAGEEAPQHLISTNDEPELLVEKEDDIPDQHENDLEELEPITLEQIREDSILVLPNTLDVEMPKNSLASLEEDQMEDQRAPEAVEYTSVLDFIKGSLTKTAEENSLLAMGDLDPEDPYIETSVRIGRFEFSRLKKRDRK